MESQTKGARAKREVAGLEATSAGIQTSSLTKRTFVRSPAVGHDLECPTVRKIQHSLSALHEPTRHLCVERVCGHLCVEHTPVCGAGFSHARFRSCGGVGKYMLSSPCH